MASLSCWSRTVVAYPRFEMFEIILISNVHDNNRPLNQKVGFCYLFNHHCSLYSRQLKPNESPLGSAAVEVDEFSSLLVSHDIHHCQSEANPSYTGLQTGHLAGLVVAGVSYDLFREMFLKLSNIFHWQAGNLRGAGQKTTTAAERKWKTGLEVLEINYEDLSKVSWRGMNFVKWSAAT